MREVESVYQETLRLDPENLSAHWGLKQVYQALGETADEEEHAMLHARYKPDDNARDHAIAMARRRYPAANYAAEAVVIYDLNRESAFTVFNDPFDPQRVSTAHEEQADAP